MYKVKNKGINGQGANLFSYQLLPQGLKLLIQSHDQSSTEYGENMEMQRMFLAYSYLHISKYEQFICLC